MKQNTYVPDRSIMRRILQADCFCERDKRYIVRTRSEGLDERLKTRTPHDFKTASRYRLRQYIQHARQCFAIRWDERERLRTRTRCRSDQYVHTTEKSLDGLKSETLQLVRIMISLYRGVLDTSVFFCVRFENAF